jgi:N-acyl-D-amino-acid deacylase
MFIPDRVAAALHVPSPPGADDIIRYMKGQPLDFDPGTQYAYSNFGFCVLGRIVERVTGAGYEDYVRSQVLAPLGITRLRCGKTRLVHRMTGEVRYYDYPGAPLAQSVFAGDGTVPGPYGGFYQEALDSHGGWVASPIDFLRLMLAADGRSVPTDIISPDSVSTMIERPEIPIWQNEPAWYAKGWLVRPWQSDANWWHNGALPGTASIVVRGYNGLTWAVFYNSQPWTDGFAIESDSRMWEAASEVTTWPVGDKFPRYVPYQGPPTVAPTVTVTSPNGKEKLTAGSTVTVSWEASDDRAIFGQGVALSLDGGSTYPVVVASDVDYRARSVQFAIPSTFKAKKARIRVIVRDADGNEAADTSDADFRIRKPRNLEVELLL